MATPPQLAAVIHADHNSTTPCLPEAIAAMAEVLGEAGNPSARQHEAGRRALGRLDRARAQVAALIGARADEIVFTSGATEACNLAILGAGERLLATRPRFVAPATEHPAVLEPMRRLAAAGADVVELAVDAHGHVDARRLEAAVDDRTALVALMLVNNESGVVHDLPRLAAIAHGRGALVLVDASQASGRVAMDVASLGADLLALSAHKCYGPQGVGALWLRRGLALAAQLHGGGQERGLRSGTHNLPGIVGFGVAAEAARRDLDARRAHLASLTRRLETAVAKGLPDVVIQGSGHGPSGAPHPERAPGTSLFTLPGLPRGWLATLATVAASGGSSCASGSGRPSHVLRAMGVADDDAANSIRIGLGLGTTAAEVDAIAAELIAGARRLRR